MCDEETFALVDIEERRAAIGGSVDNPPSFALINPCLEEGYWRGLIIDAAAHWPRWLAILYSSVFSAVNHLWLTVVAVAARNPAVATH